MKKIRLKKPILYLSGLLVVILLGLGLFFKSILLPEKAVVEEKAPEVLGQAIIASPSVLPSPNPSTSVKVLAKASLKPSFAPSITPTPSPSTTNSTTQPAYSNSAAGSGSVVNPSTSPSPSLSPSPTQSIVNVEVQGSSFSVEISGDLNVCQVLEKARAQGKISSLTLDDSYMSSMHSLYVKEMNGLSNNWTFKINGNSPLGCSLYQVRPGDQIVFKYG